MKKISILNLLVVLIFAPFVVSAQGDYKNNLLSYTMSSSSSVKPADFVTLNSEVVLTGKFPPLTNSIPNISNQQNADRIFLTDFVSGGTLFNLSYLLVGIDNPNISPEYRYEVKEVKKDNNGFVICGHIMSSSTSSGSYREAFVLKTNSAGIYQWFYRYRVVTAVSTYFNSLEPISNNGQPAGYLACGYMLDSANVKRAIVFQLDTLGKVNGGVKVLWEPSIGGFNQESEYNKVIKYEDEYYALVGYSGFIPDGCSKSYQSNVLFSMMNVTNSNIVGNIYRSVSQNQFDNQVDKGISIAKIDSGLVLLCEYYDNNGLSCSDMPDIVGHILWIYPSSPANNATWIQVKDLKYNSDPNLPSIDYPKDILYDANSGSSNHLWVYNNHDINTGSILKIDLNSNIHLIPPKQMNNNSGLAQINGKSIAFNSLGNTIGLTELYTNRYSLFEIVPTTFNCKSDSIQVNLYIDSLNEDSIYHYTYSGKEKLMEHKAYTIPVGLYLECDSVSSKPMGNSEIQDNLVSCSVYPNPFNQSLQIKLHLAREGNVRVRLYDVSGKIVLNSLFPVQEITSSTLTLDLSKINTGVYFLNVESITESFHRVVVKD